MKTGGDWHGQYRGCILMNISIYEILMVTDKYVKKGAGISSHQLSCVFPREQEKRERNYVY